MGCGDREWRGVEGRGDDMEGLRVKGRGESRGERAGKERGREQGRKVTGGGDGRE